MNVYDIISAVLGLTTVVLAGRNSKYNFWVGYVYNIFLFLLFWQQHLVAAMVLQPVAFVINMYGHWRWTHPKEEETSAADGKSLKVSSLSARNWAFAFIAVVFLGTVWALVLQKETQDPVPWLDSYLLMLTFLAQYLSAQKKWECWIVWLIVNIGNLTMYLLSGLHFMPIVSALYIVNGIWSLYGWKKRYDKGE
ncbi:MAG: nicotinamide riboside transporter PnuC [Bacteroidales bacterium]|nr:nicotinamide riboside transporter PnuC [Bacteroidales bacterium]